MLGMALLAGCADAAPGPGLAWQLVPGGTGFFIAVDGTVLTNDHVVKGCLRLAVIGPDGDAVRARRIATDPDRDLAALDTRASAVEFGVFRRLPGRSLGHRLSVVGFPANQQAGPRPSFTPLLARPLDLATDGADFLLLGDIRAGHSGSPVLDEAGRIVGMVRARAARSEVRRVAGEDAPGIGLAVSSSAVLAFLDENRIGYTTSDESQVLSDAEVARVARRFVVRVACLG